MQDPLEALRSLINASIDTVQQELADRGDAPLDLTQPQRHPLGDRYTASTSRALKCLSSAGLLLRALCDPDAWLHDIMFNYTDLAALFVACQADVANVLKDGAMDAAAIAAATGIEADKMARHLRALANLHVFREVGPDVFENNEVSTLLQSESRRALVGLCQWEALTAPDFRGSDNVRKAAFNIAYQTPLNIFEYWRSVRPDLGKRGALAFTGKGINLEQYSTPPSGTLVVDVGGGVGGATLPIVNRFKTLKLQIQDLGENKAKFASFMQTSYPDVAASGRASFQEQDFFEPNQTVAAPIYFLRHVIHDWPDAEAVRLLGRLADAMAPTSKLLICEHVVLPTYRDHHQQQQQHELTAPDPLLPNWGASFTSRLDLQVLACINARQRTEADYARLAAAANLELVRVWRNFGEEAIIELRRSTV